MNCFHTNDEIDEIGESLIRKFDYPSYAAGQAVDIERFITDYLKYKIIYDRIAEEDAGKTAFLGDGKSSLCVWMNGRRERVIPPSKTIIVDAHFTQKSMKAALRFKLAHEAGHIIMDMLNGNPVASAFNNEFDGERDYAIGELGELFSIGENQATSMGIAMLLPKSTVTKHLQEKKGQKRIPVYGTSVFLDNDRKIVHSMTEHFIVSYKSMFYRLRDLKLFDYRLIDEYLSMNLGKIGGGT